MKGRRWTNALTEDPARRVSMGLRRTVLVALVLVPLCAASVSASPDWPPPNGSEHSRILAIVTKVTALAQEVDELRSRVATLETDNAALQARVEELEARAAE